MIKVWIPIKFFGSWRGKCNFHFFMQTSGSPFMSYLSITSPTRSCQKVVATIINSFKSGLDIP